MSEERDAIAGKLSQTASVLAVWRGFLEHPGWALYSKMLQEQADGRKGEILLKPLKNAEALYAQEFSKGEISGLMLATVSPFAVLEGLKSEVEALEKLEEKQNELEKVRTDAASGSRVDDERFYGGSDR